MPEKIQLEEIQLPVYTGVVVPNDREYKHAEDTGTINLLNLSFIIKVERYTEDTRRALATARVENLATLFNEYQDEHIDSEVINLFQLRKGARKTARELEVMHESQRISSSVGFTFQEETSRQDNIMFSQQLDDIIPKTNGKEIYVALEIESKQIRKKIDYALSKNIKRFILRGGKWNNPRLWVGIISKIHKEKGIAFVSLPKRMRNDNRASFIKTAFEFGADYVFHEVMTGWQVKEILHLTSDYVYVPMPLNVALIDYTDMIEEEITENQHYAFSRVRAINIANSFVETIERIQLG